MNDDFATSLLETAEKIDRSFTPARIRALKHSYDFFAAAGMAEEDIKKAMGLTAHHLRLIRGMN